MSALTKIQDAGFNLSVHGEKLKVVPFSKLTESQVIYLKDHKPEIVAELKKDESTTLGVFVYRITDTPESELVMIAPDTTLEEAERELRLRYDDRLLSVRRKTVYKH